MAGGIDWFRWHHGTVSDLKFPLVARRAGATVAEVVAVWACLLEAASMNEQHRGALSSQPDFEAMDCALGLPDGRFQEIFQALQARKLIDDSLQIVAWQRRQPKREDDSAADRKRRQRERDTPDVTQRHAASRSVTACHDRGEESREELPTTDPSDLSLVCASKSPRPTRKCPERFVVTDEMQEWAAQQVPGIDVAAETAKLRDHTFRNAITDWPGAWRNWLRRAFESRPVTRPAPPQETAHQRTQRERMAAFAPSVAARPSSPQQEVVDVLVTRVD